jgi:SAM-dependent methyltransferase
MRYGVTGENPFETVALGAGLIPTAMTEGYAPAFGRAVVLATEMGVFDVIGSGEASAAAVAEACGTHPGATEKLLNFLVTMRYLGKRGDKYRLAGHVKRWMLSDRPNSVRDAVLMKRLEWRWIEELDSFVRTGEPVNVHETMSGDEWGAYQRGMRAQANLIAPLLSRQIPVPNGAQRMLDIGGSHGFFSVALCRRHPGLRAVVLDLPEAVEHSAPLLEREGMGDRVVHQAGDALTDDLGESVYDLILMFSLVHHFDGATNRRLVAKSARAIRPGGVLVIGEALRPTSFGRGSQLGAFFDLYFALTSESGTWTFEEMASWQREAGLVPRKPARVRFAKEIGLQVADRPPAS